MKCSRSFFWPEKKLCFERYRGMKPGFLKLLSFLEIADKNYETREFFSEVRDVYFFQLETRKEQDGHTTKGKKLLNKIEKM